MCDLYDYLERTTEVVSLALFIPSICITYFDRQFGTTLWLFATMVASILYHLCDTSNDGLTQCNTACLLSDNAGFFLDEALAFLLIDVVVLYRSDVEYKASVYAASVVMSATIFLSFPVDPGSNTDTQTIYITAFNLFLTLLLLIDRVRRLTEWKPKWTLYIAIFFAAAAIALKVVQFDSYSWIHSSWHVSGEIAIFFYIFYVASFFDYSAVALF